MSTPYRGQLDQMVWSYSRIHSYENCPANFKKTYLDGVQTVNNAFAEWGTLGHFLLESYIKGDLFEFELGEKYEELYDSYVKDAFPPSRGRPLSETYFESGYDYFNTFNGFPSEWDLIGAEIKTEFQIDGFPFVGYIDMLVRDQTDNRLIIVDHKSKSGFKNPQEKKEYSIQLYLYSVWLKQTYGEYPKQLVFNMFRKKEMVIIPFSEDDFEFSKEWAINLIHRIYQDVDFWDKVLLSYEKKNKDISTYKQNDFFCKYLCGCRKHCMRSGEQELP